MTVVLGTDVIFSWQKFADVTSSVNTLHLKTVCFSLKRLYMSTRLHGNTSHEITILIATALKI